MSVVAFAVVLVDTVAEVWGTAAVVDAVHSVLVIDALVALVVAVVPVSVVLVVRVVLAVAATIVCCR